MTDDVRTAFAALIERFGRGWERGRTDDIVGVFTADGVFRPDPFAAAVTGPEEIRRYWKEIPFEQAEIAFRAGEVFVVGPWFAAEFKCTFRRRRTGELVDVRGALFCETRDALISEMRMYHARRIGPRE